MLTEDHAKIFIKTIEEFYIKVADILLDKFSEGVHKQMVNHLGK